MVCRVGEEANVYLWVLEFLASFRTTHIGRTRNGDEVAVFEPITPVMVIEMCSLSHLLAQANDTSPVRLRPRVHGQLLRLDIGAHHDAAQALRLTYRAIPPITSIGSRIPSEDNRNTFPVVLVSGQ